VWEWNVEWFAKYAKKSLYRDWTEETKQIIVKIGWCTALKESSL